MSLKERIIESIKQEEGLTDKELSQLLNVDRTTINETCNFLKKSGVLTRTPNPLKNNNLGNYICDLSPMLRAQKQREVLKDLLPITEENIESVEKAVLMHPSYGKEMKLTHDILNAYPNNTDINQIAMKVCVIDVTNSTNLTRYKSKVSLHDIAEFILGIPNFDKRVRGGDPELVNLIARNTNTVNLFSFASKYCTYHNADIYNRDDYSIFDGVVKRTLPYYVHGLTEAKIDAWRKEFNYLAYRDCIDKLLEEKGINLEFKRRKFDHFMWYPNR